MRLEIVVLAAGKGTRMKSDLPKVLHPVGGISMLEHTLHTAEGLGPDRIHVVTGHGGDLVREQTPDTGIINWVTQEEQLGTGHAVGLACKAVEEEAVVLVLYADVPLVRTETLQPLIAAAAEDSLALLTTILENPTGYGRMLRDKNGDITGIVEERDTTNEQKSISEVNTGILAAPAGHLKHWVASLENDNAQGEYYLTDIVEMSCTNSVKVSADTGPAEETLGVNSLTDLARVERIYQERRACDLMESGVTIMDPSRLDVRGEIETGSGCTLDINVIMDGPVSLGDNVHIGANTTIRKSVIGSGSRIRENCVIEDAHIGRNAVVGPFARLRPAARLGDSVHVGNFVEIKNSRLDDGVKANHLSYIGDSSIGEATNVGAGVITCNYDGANKHHTEVGKNVFVGSDVQLVAPVSVGDNATIGAGSTITGDVPGDSLAVSRGRQRTIPGWKRPAKNSGN